MQIVKGQAVLIGLHYIIFNVFEYTKTKLYIKYTAHAIYIKSVSHTCLYCNSSPMLVKSNISTVFHTTYSYYSTSISGQ